MSVLQTSLHVMVDFETTGLDASRNFIWEIGAKAFKFVTGSEIALLDQYGAFVIPENETGIVDRFEDAQWQKFNVDNMARYQMAIDGGDRPAKAFELFHSWVDSIDDGRPAFFWSKPSSFDWPFYESYRRQLGLTQVGPFHYRRVIDLRSFMLGHISHSNQGVDEMLRLMDLQSQAATHAGMEDAISQVQLLADFFDRIVGMESDWLP